LILLANPRRETLNYARGHDPLASERRQVMETNDWSDAERRVERAQELCEQRKWLEALDELRAATSINPYNAAWFFNIGLTLDELGRTEEAIDAYRQASAIDPNDTQSLNHLAVDLHQAGRYDEALQTFTRIETLDPTFEPAYCNRILTYTELGDHEKAEEMFYLARLYKDHCPHCYYNIGCSLAARGLFDKAIYCWQKTLDLQGSHPQVHVRIAEALWNKGELEQARRHYLSGLRQDPGNTGTLLDLSELLIDLRRWDEADEKIRRAIELAPDDPASHFALGSWLLRRGHTEQAVASLSRALELDPTYPGIHLHLGKAALARRDFAEARRQLRAELLLRPDDPTMLMDLANLLIDLDEVRGGIACLKRLVNLQPDNAAAWQNLAVAQFMRSRYDEGIESCFQAIRIDPKNLMAVHNLGLALGDVRRFDEALYFVRGAINDGARDPHLIKLEFRLRILRSIDRVRQAVRRVFGKA